MREFKIGVHVRAGEHLEFGFGYIQACASKPTTPPSTRPREADGGFVFAAGPSDFRNASDPLYYRGHPGTIGLQIGDGGTPDGLAPPPGGVHGCTTVTVQDIYFTQNDINLYTCAGPLAIIR